MFGELAVALNANIMLCYDDYVHEGSVVSSNTGTVQNFELENMLTEDLHFPVIFDSNSSIITFCIDIGKSAPFNLLALLKHNILYTGKWRVQLNFSLDDPVGQEYDSGWIPVVPPQPGFGALPWGAFQWGDAMPEYQLGQYNRNAYHPLPDTVVARYITISIDAIANASQVQFFRLWGSIGYQPSENVDYGAEIVPIDETVVVQAVSGARTYGEVVQRRQINAGFSLLPRTEMLYYIVGGLYLASGISKPIICLLEPLDPANYYAEAVYGNLQKIDKSTYVSWMRWATNLSIEEQV